MIRLFVLFMTCSLVLSGCGENTVQPVSAPDTGDAVGGAGGDGDGSGGDGSGGDGTGGDGGDGTGGDGDDVAGGDPPFVTNYLVVTDTAEAVAFDADVADIATLLNQLTTIAPTQFTELPSDPILHYDGYLRINIIGTTSASISSPTSLTVRPIEHSVTGVADSFKGYANDENLETQLMHYTGTVLIVSQSFDGNASGEAALVLDIDGPLTNGVDMITVDGTLVGNIHGTDAGLLHAIGGSSAGVGGSMTSTISGAFIISQNADLDARLQSP